MRRELRTGPQTGIINRSDINSVQSCFCCCWCLPGRAPDTKKECFAASGFSHANLSKQITRVGGRGRGTTERQRPCPWGHAVLIAARRRDL